MPNFDIRAHYYKINRSLQHICEKRIMAARIDFPLTYDDIQHLMLDVETLELVNKLKNEHKFKTIQSFNTIYVRSELRDDITHLPVIQLENTKGWYLKEEMERWGRSATVFSVDLNMLQEDKRTAVISWINNNVLERRQKDLVELIVQSYLQTIQPTLWHVICQWNTLSLGFDREISERAREKPLRKARYRWDYNSDTLTWYNNNKKYIEFIDSVLLGAQVLPSINERDILSKGISASIYSYTKRAGEIV